MDIDSQPQGAESKGWRTVERLGKIFALPLAIAVIGYFIQARLQDRGIDRDFVQIAVGILKDPTADDEQKKWASELINHHSQVKLQPKLKEGLATGELNLPDPYGVRSGHTAGIGSWCKRENPQNTCPGDALRCGSILDYVDEFKDTWKVTGAYATVTQSNLTVRIPESGNLGIASATGNTTCVIGDFVACLIGPAFSTRDGLPGEADVGRVEFAADYVVQEFSEEGTFAPVRKSSRVEYAPMVFVDWVIQIQDYCNGRLDHLGCDGTERSIEGRCSARLGLECGKKQ